jgi:hypothetical protein
LVAVRTGRAGQTKRLPRHVLNETQWAGHATCFVVRANRSQKVTSVAFFTRRFCIGTRSHKTILASATVDAGGFFGDTKTSTPFSFEKKKVLKKGQSHTILLLNIETRSCNSNKK